MAPKQKEQKKGPTYKIATAPKDIVPGSVKEPPREFKPPKIPQSFPESQEKNEGKMEEFPDLFEQWPSEEVIKAHDFGINSQAKFEDKDHQLINQYIEKELEKEKAYSGWKPMDHFENYSETEDIDEEEKEVKSMTEIQKSHQVIEGEPKQEELENGKKGNVVIETYLREQTEQQMERRKKDEADKAQKAAKDKKKGKKQETKEDGPQQISDVKMADIIVKRGMCPSAVWIGSQLQMIKQRNITDVYTEEAVWKKIYPQENGVPQITQSGKYWVKLYYMGKAIKVEVDDRIPLNHELKSLFPLSEKFNEKWSIILTKALIKYFALACPHEKITGSGMIIYALTGMISENVSLQGFKDWKKVAKLMEDNHYKTKDIILSCFSDVAKEKRSPSNYVRGTEELKDIILFENSTFKKKRLTKSSSKDLQLNEIDQGEQMYIQNHMLGGYAYCLGDYFQNDEFNMVFSKERSPKQIQLRNEYNQMSKVSFNNKTRDQKLEHRRKKKQIKQSLLIEEKKRVEQINKPKVEYHFVKLLSDIRINCEYSEKQILLAKKCVLNNLAQPPNYDIPIEKQESSQSISLIKLKQEAEQVRPLDDFSSIYNAKEIYVRKDEGVWIKDEDLVESFENVQIYYNPNIFENKSIERVEFKGADVFTYEEEKEILVIEKIGPAHQEENQETNNIPVNVLFGFSVQESKWDSLNKPYTMLQKFDFQSYKTTSNVVTLKEPICSTYLNLKNRNTVFKIYTMSKGRYSYWVGSNASYKLMSIAQYLTDFEGYSAKVFNIEYPALEGKVYSQLARISIKHEGEQNNTIILKLNNCAKEFEKFLSFRLVKLPTNHEYTTEKTEGIITKPNQSIHLVYEYTRITIEPNYTYYLIVEGYPSENVIEGSFDLTMLSKISEVSLEQIEQVEPVKVVEKYSPNKYGTIFKERIFSNSNANVGFLFKVIEGEEGQAIQADKKGAKKGGKDQPAFQIIEKPLEQNRLVHLKILRGRELIYYQKGINQVIIPNIEVQNTKGEEIEYSLQASFDLREWPEACLQNQETNKIYWVLQVTGQDSLAIVRDTLQEEKEKQTRKSWEEKQPGRAEKAKKARERFLLQMKKEKAEELTQEELAIINAPRLTKKQMQEEEKKNQDKKGGKGGKKDDKKAGKDAKKEEAVEEKLVQKELPKSQDNFMIEVKQFLRNLEQSKVSYVSLQNGQQTRIRTEQQQKAIKEGAMMSKQNRVGQISRNIEARQAMKIRERQKKDKLTIILEDAKEQFKNEWNNYIKWRTEDLEKDRSKQQKQRSLIDVVKQEKPSITQADLAKLINQYREIKNHNKLLVDVGDMVRKNIKINGIIQRITNHLGGWEVDELKGIMEEVKNEKVQGIQEQLLKQVNEMLEEAEKNPTVVQEKQAELKKAKKGGKK